jgi:GxxExxY protein
MAGIGWTGWRNEVLASLTSRIIKCAVEVHRRLGPGLLESVYHVCLAFELRAAGLTVVENMPVPVCYKDIKFDCAFRADFLVNDTAIVEIKAVAELAAVHEAQLLTYLRLTDRPVGLLLNFNVPILKQGIRRKLNPGTATSTRTPTNLRGSVSLS